MGGGTDYPEWFYRYPGQVISTTIDKYCYISIRRLRPGVHGYNYRLVYSKIDEAKQLSGIRHPTARAAIQYYGHGGHYEIHHDADLPAGTGLGSSSAFTVGLLHGLAMFSPKEADRIVDPHELAHRAFFIEREIIKECVGAQDQYATAIGGLNKISFTSKGIFASPIVCPGNENVKRNLESRCLLFYTHTRRSAPAIAATYFEDIGSKDKYLHNIQKIVPLGEMALDQNNMGSFGAYLYQGWKMKSGLSFQVSNSSIDEVMQLGIDAGAHGGKMLGAGGGGFILFIVPTYKQDRVIEAMQQKGLAHVPFKFTDTGSEIIFNDENYK